MSLPCDGTSKDNHGSSPVDVPYSGSSNIEPVSPTPSRRYTQEQIPWMNGSQASLTLEFGPTEPGVTRDPGSVVDQPDALMMSKRLSPISVGDELSRSPNPEQRHVGVVSSPSQLHPGDNILRSSSESPQQATLQPLRSSTVTSHRSVRTGLSIGRASYRHYEGPSPRSPSPALQKTVSSTGHQTFHPNLVARTDNGNRPGQQVIGLKGLRFAPMSVNCIRRYARHETMKGPSASDYMIKALQYKYPSFRDVPPAGWEAHRHPEGAQYFLHRGKRIMTDVNICDGDVCVDIENFSDYLREELRLLVEARNLPLRLDEVELVLEPMSDEEGVLCCYYFVNPSARCLFWTDEWEPKDILGDCMSIESLSHKGLGVQCHYWKHWELFPALCRVTEEIKVEVKDMILLAACTMSSSRLTSLDHLTSDPSSSTLDVEELRSHLSLVDAITANASSLRGHSAIIIGRIMYTFCRNFFLNFDREDGIPMNTDQGSHWWRYQLSKLMAICAPILFMSPLKTVRSLHKIFVNRVASKRQWNAFVTKLDSQLQETNLLATVLLNANVGFLAIQSVDSGGGTSLRQIASYTSLVSSIASIVLGLVLVGHNRTETRNSAFQATKFLRRLHHKKHGLETLGIIYSLPHALLLWAMVLFFIAFSAEWSGPSDIASRLVVGIFVLLVGLLVMWCIWKERDPSHHWWFQPDPEHEHSSKGAASVHRRTGEEEDLSVSPTEQAGVDE